MRITKPNTFLIGFYLALLVWWFTILFSHLKGTPFNLAFAFAYGLIPLFGGVFGLRRAREWGMLKSAMGKAILFFSLGLITWGLGEMVWSYYNFVLHVEIPYPSWSDAFFVVSWPLWGVGVWFLSYATGAKFGLRKTSGMIQIILLPVTAIFASYYLLIVIARKGVIDLSGDLMKVFFDIAYPLFDVIVISLAAVIFGLSLRYLGGKYRIAVLVTLFGFVINYFADFGFSYTTTVETFFNGNWVDLLFMSAMFCISMGVNSFSIKD